MKVTSSTSPDKKFSVSPDPRDPSTAIIRFYDNITQISEGYEYDEYHLSLPYYKNLSVDIEANISPYFSAAMKTEAPSQEKQIALLQSENAILKAKVAELAKNLDNTSLALCDIYEKSIGKEVAS
jgi:hypothetical protein